ncbi:hypothetical protein AOE01nite_11720 [Acetobacter oeni]|uniref:HTH merR-type domain-containing protein n=1 Tax=Acetobacter oeni TaxID=304077 RepID=A0A511XJ32_9PROT|nr:MerR family transcriptional regulator [Acetobacter oeni]MBB3882694.1 DNA-binding transcriptional MerR regulator [Acetobacter oeni]NHO18796.1 MerR family transcriptional regulator [Acetobacter oeni]GBR04211.1 MerR family transcriptional regulator [Acetobacter oeni LMG 21952]GEN62948.1 hypothetical protein AOE01nite_11720 [Acetobacter oeni]
MSESQARGENNSAASSDNWHECEANGQSRKGPLAFRTISEVADELKIPQHVLRFWEARFEQVRPLKRGGGRRYYRPEDIDLLRSIADLLYVKGYTIKGVQRVLHGQGEETAGSDQADVKESIKNPTNTEYLFGDASPQEKCSDEKAVALPSINKNLTSLSDYQCVCEENSHLRSGLLNILTELQFIKDLILNIE